MKLNAQGDLNVFNITNEQFIYLASIVYHEVDIDANLRLWWYNASHWFKAGYDTLLIIFFLPQELSWYVSIIDHDYVSFTLFTVDFLWNSRINSAQLNFLLIQTD